MIILRMRDGIIAHFPSRVSEWIMTAAILGWYGVLSADPGTFETSRSFTVLAYYGSEKAWAMLCLLVGLVRLAALVVNGTFRSFRYSPHMRGFASIVACIFWGQITLGVIIAWTMGGAGTGVVAYGTFMIIEMWNLFRAWADVGATRKAG
ncbi:hypothetical protein GRZ55_11515 [Chelativorans sp. ZYF759]|uniref:hypothetical protein n=1 Tax=Chelativorans sp. ZYF759 TaxID=2692213 RepID=UPI00145CFE4B|nr:hypothetical protein [Chelativorans sp. ZYF759]NMG39871.1 hypothetical protein [Chelativorans sp. ZYF759]